MGILLALIAMFSWGLGDFLIQKSAQKMGVCPALFFVTAFGAVVLCPFIIADLPEIFGEVKTLGLLVLVSVIILAAGILDFKALKLGKISVIEPIFAIEIPITAGLAALVIREYLSRAQIFLVILLFIGIFLLVTKSFDVIKKIKLERGVWQAMLATVGMGVVNFLVGIGSREVGPLMVNWFMDIFLAVCVLAFLLISGRGAEIKDHWKKNKRLILSVGFFDKLAWVAFAFSMVYIPIAITTSISESYIALAAILGFVYNKEKLLKHQWAGLVLTVITGIILATTVE